VFEGQMSDAVVMVIKVVMRLLEDVRACPHKILLN
jgi:hypothetical protein